MKPPPMTEKQFQAQVVELAQTLGWLVYHTYDSRRSAPGFPDLVMVRNDHLIFAELKSAKGKLTPEQGQWLDALQEVQASMGGYEGYDLLKVETWRPGDWDKIVEVLR